MPDPRMPDPLMPGRFIVALAGGGGVLLLATIIHAGLAGDLRAEGAVLTDLLWGRVLLVDVYLGFALFGAWIGWRERMTFAAMIWIVALLCLGNIVACAYLVQAWWRARGDADAFWHGRRATARERRG